MHNLKYLITSVLIAVYSLANAQLVITVAGQIEIPGTEDGPAFNATFNNPHGIAVDQQGNVYTSDRWSHIIRKISPDGIVTTIAGTPDVSGDQDGLAINATFNEPWGLCVDHLGNILVADTRNNKIRKISPSGMVSTIAGSGNFGSSDGMGAGATFGNPTGIECDENGNIYVADHLTHIIRKIDPSGMVTTIAGTPYQMGTTDGPGIVAQFARPYGLSLDNEGNILIADEWNHKIRKIDQSGIVSTVAGVGIVGSQDGAAESSTFNYPWDITVDSSGNIFVADGYNYLIRKIDTDNQVNSFAGTLETTGANDGMGLTATFSGATALAISPLTKEIYVGDAYNNLVRKIIDLNQGVSLLTSNNQNAVCQGETITLNASPTIYNQYFFYMDGQLVQSSSDPSFTTGTDWEVGSYEIEVVAQDANSTVPSRSVSITILPNPTVEVSLVGNTTFYEGDSVTLIASQGVDYFWSTGETTAAITVYEAGVYSVEVSNENGCYGDSEPIVVEVLKIPDAPQISLTGDQNICPGEAALLSSNYVSGNQWLKDGWPISGEGNQNLMVKTSGSYQVQIVDDNGIIVLSDPVEINQLPGFQLTFSADETSIEQEEEVQFEITNQNLIDFSWDFGDGNFSTDADPVHTYAQTGVFSVSASAANEYGCRDTLMKASYIEVREKDPISDPAPNNPEPEIGETDIFIPNAFTPNGDGENDQFSVLGSNIQDVSMSIYNQWGELIYIGNNGWNGQQNGLDVQNGNYVYCVAITTIGGTQKQYAGRVTIIR